MASEESTKRIARDIEIYKKRDDVREIEDSGGSTENKNLQRGTKDLMAAIQAGIKKDALEDIEDIEATEE